MPDIFRFQTLRGVEELPNDQLDQLSIPTHSENNKSEWYKMLEGLCKLKDYKEIVLAILGFLRSENAIHSIEQLDSDFQPVFAFVENKGTIKTKEDLKQLFGVVDRRKLSDFFKEKSTNVDGADGKPVSIKTSKYSLELQNVSDTMLSLAILGKLGHKDNINYNLLFKVFALLKLLFEKNEKVSLAEIAQLFDKTTTLPACFFKLNPCSKKLEPLQIETPFGHLGIFDFGATEDASSIIDNNTGVSEAKKEKSQLEVNEKSEYENKNAPAQSRSRITGAETKEVVLGITDEAKEAINRLDPGACDCKCNESCKGQNPCCATIKPFITDLMVVREELHCYKAKHLAYVETVMLGEERVREHRHLERTEDYSEKETTLTKSEEKDHQVSERFSLQTETEKTIESDLSIDAGVTANTSGPSYKISTSLDVSSQNSKSQSQRVAREQAVDITERTVRKIQETVRELTSKKKIVETEETNTHTFANNTASSQKHINGMYQFINAEYRGQVMNYGKRLMFEFILPEPLQLYKQLMSKEIAPFGLTEPEKPDLSIWQISETNDNPEFFYTNLAKEYNVQDLPAPPVKDKTISFVFGNNDVLNKDDKAYGKHELIEIGTVPQGYFAWRADIIGEPLNFEGDNEYEKAKIFIEGKQLNIAKAYNTAEIYLYEGDQIRASLLCDGTVAVSGSGTIRCRREAYLLDDWKLKVYQKIMLKYEADLNEYKAELARHKAAKAQKNKFGRNPFLNREIERTELKRMAISYISCQFYDQFTAMKRNVKPCGYPQMDLEQAEKDGKFIQFFEQLFDWNLMTYLFYPYFWGQKCEWANKVQEDSGDPLFDKALMAGAARLQVPVKSGHEPLAMHWITFGELWQGTGQPPVPGSPYYISMAQEIKEQKGIFNVDREGTLNVVNGEDVVTLSGSSYYWNFTSDTIDKPKVDNDIDREIILDCVTYRIVAITQVGSSTDQWTIKLERVYEGPNHSYLKWSTGAVFVGAEFPITVPTNLVYLKNKKVNGEYVTEDCLPCFDKPEAKCE